MKVSLILYVLFYADFLLRTGANKPCCQHATEYAKPLDITIFFSSLCLGSRSFIINQFYPNYKGLRRSISVRWILYQDEMENREGFWHFGCKRGAKECEYNRYIACGLDQDKSQDSDVEFIRCVMVKFEFDRCIVNLGYNYTQYCHCKSGEGFEILAKHGAKVKQMPSKRLHYLPAIIYNNQNEENLDMLSTKYFLETVCNEMQSPKPMVCCPPVKKLI